MSGPEHPPAGCFAGGGGSNLAPCGVTTRQALPPIAAPFMCTSPSPTTTPTTTPSTGSFHVTFLSWTHRLGRRHRATLFELLLYKSETCDPRSELQWLATFRSVRRVRTSGRGQSGLKNDRSVAVLSDVSFRICKPMQKPDPTTLLQRFRHACWDRHHTGGLSQQLTEGRPRPFSIPETLQLTSMSRPEWKRGVAVSRGDPASGAGVWTPVAVKNCCCGSPKQPRPSIPSRLIYGPQLSAPEHLYKQVTQ